MSKLDELRQRFAKQRISENLLMKGVLAAATTDQTETVALRYKAGVCPGCAQNELSDLGFRHGGVHVRCNKCGFEFTKKTFTDNQEKLADEHATRVAGAAVRHTLKAVKQKEKDEARASGRPIRRGKYSLVHLPNGDTDAILHFGKHRDKYVSDLAEDPLARGYIRWMLAELTDLDEELRAVLEKHKDW